MTRMVDAKSASLGGVIDRVMAIGDVSDIGCWSGIPYHFWRAAQRAGLAVEPGRLDLSRYRWARRRWNLSQWLSGNGFGGYQYSEKFLARAERETIANCRNQTVLSFHHHFPRARSVQEAGGRIVYYLDAILAAELDGHALTVELPRKTAERALEIERENLANAHHVVTMARWLRDYLVENGLAPPERVSVILPGANLDLPQNWRPRQVATNANLGSFVLGFIGNDWQRKGLPLLIEVVRRLRHSGLPVRIVVIGKCPPIVAPDCVEVLGPLDKQGQLPRFIEAVQRCDLGCLFSEREAFGISVLEFLRLGVPVAGFANEGPADSIPPDAGIRFEPGTNVESIAERLAVYIRNTDQQREMRCNAVQWSPQVTWERCLKEFRSVLDTGVANCRVCPWLGLGGANIKS